MEAVENMSGGWKFGGSRRWPAAAVLLLTLVAVSSASAAAKVDFNRDIRPILSDNCFSCHGPDEKTRKAKLRLDLREQVIKTGDNGSAPIFPGDLAKSLMVQRITTKDADDLMPPPKSGKKLTVAQIDLLQKWIAEGAEYKGHWAFTKPERPTPPMVKNPAWAKNDIDKFILARLEKEGLTPAKEADKTVLIRRVTLDLTGLPPTTEQVDEFLADTGPDAYEKLVDRLLQSPRFGEQMARYWLDGARYADSHGYHIDSERSLWKYREWVIEAFNQNKPFDQFTLEQLAGDLLPDATTDQKIASGFVRANMSTGEGGAIVEEYQAKYTFDRLETSSTMFMGLTMTCARCHTHKYDPITQREYYGLFAFFNNLNESVMDGNRPNPDPFIKVPTPAQTERLAWLKQHIDTSQKSVEVPMPELDAAQAKWQERWHKKLTAGLETLAYGGAKSAVDPKVEFKLLADRSILVVGANPTSDVQEISIRLSAGNLAALRLETLPYDSLPMKGAARADDGRFRLAEIEAELIAPGADSKAVKLKFARAIADAQETKFEIDKAIDGKKDTGWGVAADAVTQSHTALFVLDKPAKVVADSELRVRLSYEASPSKRALGHFRLAAARNDEIAQLLNPPKFGNWQMLGPLKPDDGVATLDTVFEPEKEIDFKKTYPGVRDPVKWAEEKEFGDGKANLLVQDLHGIHGVRYLYRTLNVPVDRSLDISLRADGIFKMWVNGELVLTRDREERPGDGPARASVKLKKGENKFLAKILTVQGAANFTFDKDPGGADTLTPDIAALLATAKSFSGEPGTRLRNYYRRENSPEFRKTFDELESWKQENGDLDKAIPTTLVAKERDKPRETRMLRRGEYDKRGDVVTAGIPALFPPLPKDAPTNRLGFARWLLDPAHPLTARVNVNRFWQQYFGTGFVKTAEDFGLQGEFPSHPDLLDWLATGFIASGWNIKQLQRLIVTSAAYRQSAACPPALRARDPENRLLARGPRFRMDGEMVRDTALFLSGLLVEEIGGRSVKPYQPAGLWEAVSFNNSQKYVQDTGEANYRRSLYTYWKRQSPPPNMLIFDAATREYCVVKRPRTNTPLQALVVLNDPQFVEAARAFAARMITEGGATAEERIRWAFRRATSRMPTAEEVQILRAVLDQQLPAFKANADAANRFLSVGAFHPAARIDPGELAAWTTVATMLLNLDETVTKG